MSSSVQRDSQNMSKTATDAVLHKTNLCLSQNALNSALLVLLCFSACGLTHTANKKNKITFP